MPYRKAEVLASVRDASTNISVLCDLAKGRAETRLALQEEPFNLDPAEVPAMGSPDLTEITAAAKTELEPKMKAEIQRLIGEVNNQDHQWYAFLNAVKGNKSYRDIIRTLPPEVKTNPESLKAMMDTVDDVSPDLRDEAKQKAVELFKDKLQTKLDDTELAQLAPFAALSDRAKRIKDVWDGVFDDWMDEDLAIAIGGNTKLGDLSDMARKRIADVIAKYLEKGKTTVPHLQLLATKDRNGIIDAFPAYADAFRHMTDAELTVMQVGAQKELIKRIITKAPLGAQASPLIDGVALDSVVKIRLLGQIAALNANPKTVQDLDVIIKSCYGDDFYNALEPTDNFPQTVIDGWRTKASARIVDEFKEAFVSTDDFADGKFTNAQLKKIVNDVLDGTILPSDCGKDIGVWAGLLNAYQAITAETHFPDEIKEAAKDAAVKRFEAAVGPQIDLLGALANADNDIIAHLAEGDMAKIRPTVEAKADKLGLDLATVSDLLAALPADYSIPADWQAKAKTESLNKLSARLGRKLD